MNNQTSSRLALILLSLTLLGGGGSGSVAKLTQVKFFDGASWNQNSNLRFTVNLPVDCTGWFTETLGGNQGDSGNVKGGLYVRDMFEGSNQVIPYPGFSRFWSAHCS